MGVLKMVLSAVTNAAAAIFNRIRETGRRILTKAQEFCGKILSWASKQINMLKEKMIKVYGSVYSMLRTENGYVRKAEHYTMCRNGDWVKETIVSQREISEEKVPPEIIEMTREQGLTVGGSVNITDHVQICADEMQELELVG